MFETSSLSSSKQPNQSPQDLRKIGGMRYQNRLAIFLGEISFITAPKPRVHTLVPVWYHQHHFGSCQCNCKGRSLWGLQKRWDVQILGVGQHAAPSSLQGPWPTVPHFFQKLKDTFLPGMADEQLTLQAIWMSHQCPTHLPCLSGHWFDILFIHRVDARPIGLRRIILGARPNLTVAQGRADLLAQKTQISMRDAPSISWNRPMQVVG